MKQNETFRKSSRSQNVPYRQFLIFFESISDIRNVRLEFCRNQGFGSPVFMFKRGMVCVIVLLVLYKILSFMSIFADVYLYM